MPPRRMRQKLAVIWRVTTVGAVDQSDTWRGLPEPNLGERYLAEHVATTMTEKALFEFRGGGRTEF